MKKIILYIVDDYLLNRITQIRYFENDKRFIIEDFQNAEECLKKMEKRQPDVVLMDIELPKMNGIEATKIINEKFPKTKVVMFTSYQSEERVLASLACGACGYVLKNNPETNLKNVVERVVAGEFWMDLKIAKLAFGSIPSPNIKDLENLYENKKLRNSLTDRELEVLRLLIDGKTNSQIANEIIISTNTAKAHVGNILMKLSVNDRVQAAVKAVRANLF